MKKYSTAEARNQLSKLVHEVEGTGHIELTRRGKPVAIVLSLKEYDRLQGKPSRPLWEAVAAFREEHASDLSELAAALDDLQQQDAGRHFAW